jgi:hypothetical protein
LLNDFFDIEFLIYKFMKYSNLNLDELYHLRTQMVMNNEDSSELNFLIDCGESEYYLSLFEDTSATGGPAGSSGAASIGIGGGGVAYGNAAFGGMGAVTAAQPSNNAGVTSDPAYTAGGGKIGSGDVSVPYNAGPNKSFQKIPVDNRKGNSKRRKNKMLSNLKSLVSRQDFTAGQGSDKPKRLMSFDSFSKDELNKVTKVKE